MFCSLFQRMKMSEDSPNEFFFDEQEDTEQDKDDCGYEVLKIHQIYDLMLNTISKIKCIISLPTAIIRLLLSRFKWDVETLSERLYDGKEEQLFDQLGIKFSKTKISTKSCCQQQPVEHQSKECKICYLMVDQSDMFCLECRHEFCKSCWENYLKAKIYNQNDCITCCECNCNVVVDDDQVFQLVNDPAARLLYQRLITNSFVDTNKQLRWCPTPNCMHVIQVKCSRLKNVKCICSNEICFCCGNEDHTPIECQLLKAWNLKAAGFNDEKVDGQTVKWLITHTKDCPKCNASIEKSGGCNHMTCKKTSCKYEFCWVCLGPWKSHGGNYYSCNKYDEKKVANSKNQTRLLLERYYFYWNRFSSHLESLQLENKIKNKIGLYINDIIEKFKVTPIETQFLYEAFDVLRRCRRTLMYTYVFSFYCQENSQVQIFMANQNDLQIQVEHLSECLENKLIVLEYFNFKATILHLKNYCQQRRNVLIEHISEGTEKDWWTYNLEI